MGKSGLSGRTVEPSGSSVNNLNFIKLRFVKRECGKSRILHSRRELGWCMLIKTIKLSNLDISSKKTNRFQVILQLSDVPQMELQAC